MAKRMVRDLEYANCVSLALKQSMHSKKEMKKYYILILFVYLFIGCVRSNNWVNNLPKPWANSLLLFRFRFPFQQPPE